MSLEVAATKFALPLIGTAGGAGLLLTAAATSGVEGFEKYGPYGLLALLLVWMTQQLTKQLAAILQAVQELKASSEALRAQLSAMRAAIERQEHRLEAVEDVVKLNPRRGT